MYAGQDVNKSYHIPPAARVNNASFSLLSPGYIDSFGYSSVRFDIGLGATDIAMAALKVQESDDHSTWSDVTGADFSVSPATLPASTDSNHVFSILIPVNGLRKRYFKLVATAGNGASGTFLTCLVTLGNPLNAPATTAARGYTQELIVAG